MNNQNNVFGAIIYKVPSTTFTYLPGSSVIQQTYHRLNKTWYVKANSKRGRYLIGLTAAKGKLSTIITEAGK